MFVEQKILELMFQDRTEEAKEKLQDMYKNELGAFRDKLYELLDLVIDELKNK